MTTRYRVAWWPATGALTNSWSPICDWFSQVESAELAMRHALSLLDGDPVVVVTVEEHTQDERGYAVAASCWAVHAAELVELIKCYGLHHVVRTLGSTSHAHWYVAAG